MKQTVATTTIFKAILAFTILFAAFLALAITYNKAYKLKNESISILEKYEGTSAKSLGIVNNYLKNSGYTTRSECDAGEYGARSLDQVDLELADGTGEYFYCLSQTCTNGNCDSVGNNKKVYYKLKVFFRFNLPFFNELLTFPITGETKAINFYDLNQKLS